jgi:proliferating cell nuclear antigen PCNA
MITINDSKKRRIFTILFQIIKSCSSIVHIHLKEDKMYIQGMDHSQVCLFDIEFKQEWFASYDDINDTLIHIDTFIFYNILSFNSTDTKELKIILGEDGDSIQIDFNIDKYSKYFTIPLIDTDYSWMTIPSYDYDSEFTISSKIICEICSQLITFGDVLTIHCTEENIVLYSKDVTKGEMKVVISIDDLDDYSIIENTTIVVQYSLNYIQKFCLNTHLSNQIQFSISKEVPLKIAYLSQTDDCIIQFFVSPKIEDFDAD